MLPFCIASAVLKRFLRSGGDDIATDVEIAFAFFFVCAAGDPPTSLANQEGGTKRSFSLVPELLLLLHPADSTRSARDTHSTCGGAAARA